MAAGIAQAARAVVLLVCAHATVFLVIALQLVGRQGHANVVPVAPSTHAEPGPIDHDDDDSGVVFAFTLRTCLGFVGTLLVAALSSSAGIGGGAFFVPLFYAVSGFSLKAATGLSQAAIAGGSLISMLFNLSMRHPWDPGRPLVDLDLALVLTPAMLLGVSIGVLLNDLLPTWAVLVLLVSLVALTCKRVTLRGLNAWAEEQQKVAAAHAAAAIQSGPVPRLAPIHITHVPSTTWPQRIQVVISREASRAQISADSSDDEDGSAGVRRSNSALMTNAALITSPPAKMRVEVSPEASTPMNGGAGEFGAGAGIPPSESAGVLGHKSALATVPSGDSEGLSGEAEAAARMPSTESVTSAMAAAAAEGTGVGGGGRGQGRGGRGGGGGGGARAPLRTISWEGGGERGGSSGWHGEEGDPFFGGIEGNGQLEVGCNGDAEGEEDWASIQRQRLRQARQQQEMEWVLQQQAEKQAADVQAGGGPQRSAEPQAPEATHPQAAPVAASPFSALQSTAADAAAAAAPKAPVNVVNTGGPPGARISPSPPSWAGSLQRSSSSAAASSPRLQLRFPWIKLVSLTLLWLGFLGLSALDALLPLCSVQYIAYMLLFLVITLGVTAVFIQAIFLAPSSLPSSRRPPRRKPWLHRHPNGAGQEEGPQGVAGAGAPPGSSGALQQPLLDAGGGSAGSGFMLSPDRETMSSETPPSLSVVAALSAAVAGAAGLLAGTAGLGGGHMLGSVMLDFRVHPQVATATTTVLLFISSTAATLSYIMERRLITSYAVAFAACSALGSLIGVFFIAGAVRRSGRGSVVTLLLAAAVGCGALLTAGLGGWDVAEEIKRHGAFGGFEYICR